jgi:hypothetical protein
MDCAGFSAAGFSLTTIGPKLQHLFGDAFVYKMFVDFCSNRFFVFIVTFVGYCSLNVLKLCSSY